MQTYIVCGVQIEVDNLVINHDGEIENWDLFIGGVEIICSCDFLSKFIIDELEKKILKELK